MFYVVFLSSYEQKVRSEAFPLLCQLNAMLSPSPSPVVESLPFAVGLRVYVIVRFWFLSLELLATTAAVWSVLGAWCGRPSVIRLRASPPARRPATTLTSIH